MKPFFAIIALSIALLLTCPSLGAIIKREDKPKCRNTHTVFSENTDGWKADSSPKDTFKKTSNGLEMRLLKPQTTPKRLIDKETELPYNSESGIGPTFNSTTFMHYGRFTAVVRAAPVGGAVTAVILIADNHDEIDFEFTGGAPHTAQTNYFWGEHPEYTVNGGSHDVDGGSIYDEFHTYTIDWTPERIEWSIDGKVVRVKKKEDTCDGGVCKYPTHPARVQVGLWDGSFEYGTAEWAKGPINWDDHEYISAYLKEIRIECDPDYNEIVE